MLEMKEIWIWSLGWGDPPAEKKWQPIPVFLPGKCYRQRSLVDYSPWEMLQTEEPGGLQSMGNATDRGAWWATVHGKCYRQRSTVHGKCYRQRSLVDYSPWDCKDSDTAEATEHTCRHLLEKHTLLLYVWAFIPFTLIMLWHVPHSVFLSLHTFFFENYLCSGSLIKAFSIADMQHTWFNTFL